jgi:hypothetical protein
MASPSKCPTRDEADAHEKACGEGKKAGPTGILRVGVDTRFLSHVLCVNAWLARW